MTSDYCHVALDPENGNVRGRVIEGQPEARMRMFIGEKKVVIFGRGVR